MPFTLCFHGRFPVQCAVTYDWGFFLRLPPAYFFGFGQLILPERCSILVLLTIPSHPSKA